MTQKFDMNEQMESAAKELGFDAGSSNDSDWFKISEGDNKVRILTPLVVFPQHFNKSGYTGICLGKEMQCPGCIEDDKRRDLKTKFPKENEKLQFTRNIKWFGWLLDYKDGHIKLAKLAHKVAQQIQALQNNPEYAFAEAPMPYDITITAKDAGKTTVSYLVTPARANSPVSEDITKDMERKHSAEDIKERMKLKKAKELGLAPADAPEKEIEYPEQDINPEDIPF